MPRSSSKPVGNIRKAVDAIFPLKGIHTDAPRGIMSNEFGVRLINVRPQDTRGRLRGSQRPGTSKYIASTINGANAIQAMHQSVTIRSPDAVVVDDDSTIYLQDAFTQANGALDADGDWECSSNSSTTILRSGVSSSSTNNLVVRSNKIEKEDTTANQALCGYYVSTLNTPVGTVIRGTFNLQYTNPMSDVSDVVGGTCKLIHRIDPGDLSRRDQLIQFVFCRHFCAIIQGEPTPSTTAFSSFTSNSRVAYYLFPTPLTAGTHTCDLRTRQRNDGTSWTEGWIDGVKMVEKNITAGDSNTNDAVGFALGCDAANNAESCDDFIVYTGTLAVESEDAGETIRQVNLIVVSGGNIYVGDGDGANMELCTGGTAAITTDANVRVQIAASRGYAYIVDGGQNCKRVNILSKQVDNLTATVGSAPEFCQLVTFWRDRLVLASPSDAPMNLFASRAGTHTDFDTSEEDEGAAFAFNAAAGAYIGEPINAIAPFNDDEMLVSGDSDLWRLAGDPTAGGSLDVISQANGMLGPRAWCVDPYGIIYFLGTGGFYRIIPGGLPESLSRGKTDAIFTAIDRQSNIIRLEWDRDRQGCNIFITPVDTGAATHYWYDARTEGIFAVQYPNAHGPVSTLVFDGDAQADRYVLLGGRDGYIRKVDELALTDDGTTIAAEAWIGPIVPFPEASQAILTDFEPVLGEISTSVPSHASVFRLRVDVLSGQSEYEGFEGGDTRGYNKQYTTGGKQTRVVRRLAGGVFYLKLTSNGAGSTWCVERFHMNFEPAGRRVNHVVV